MPYVEGFGTWPFGEEWLWEAVACVYLPLLELLDGAPVTVGLTPVLCDQLEAMRGEAGERYLRFLREVRAPIHEEDAAGLERGGEPLLAAEVRRAAGDYTLAERGLRGARPRPARRLPRASSGVELWTSSATHAVLPLLATDAGLRLQLATGVASHSRASAAGAGGFWLPECAYAPGLERELADHGVRAFCVDQTARAAASTTSCRWRPRRARCAVPIDWQTVELVWHGERGYPVDGTYRDYHRRTVHDLKPWNNAGGPYDREAARELARAHARDFVERAAARVAAGGLLCCALDTELLGHWWYEGPAWLAAVLEEAPRHGLRLVTASRGPRARRARRAAAGGLELGAGQGPVDLGRAARRRVRLRRARRASCAPSPPPPARARPRTALERAARELLALQASDWAVHGHPRARRRLPARAARRRTAEPRRRARRSARLRAPRRSPRLRDLAPHLDLASLTTP